MLQVCSLFHELGHLSLFHHVRVATVKSWEAMFGIEGYLATTDSGGKGHGHRVREVQLDRAVTERQDSGEIHLLSAVCVAERLVRSDSTF